MATIINIATPIPTGQRIRFDNGRMFSIYSKVTKKGIRFYYATRERMFPISTANINQYIYLG
jgi:hypothetical protein